MRTLETFFETAAGCQLRRWEAAQADRLLERVAGTRALQVGAPYGSVLRAAPHSTKILTCESLKPLGQNELAISLSFNALPFRENTFDLVVLVHALERAPYESSLDEALRVLVPEGRLVILGLNPWGPWWLKGKQKVFGEGASPVSVARIKSAIGNRAVIDRGRFGVYCPSLADNPLQLSRWSWVEKAGDRWWPALANGFMLSAIKREAGAKLVGKLSAKKLLQPQWEGAAARTVND